MNESIRLHEVETFARELIAEYVPEYKFKWTRAIHTLGVCRYRSKTIGLSRHYALQERDELIIDTVLHEIAHALVGPKNGHNHVWKAKCREIGARPVRCKTEVRIEVPHKYELRCTKCPKIWKRYRKPSKRMAGMWHEPCKAGLTVHKVA